MAAKKRSTKAPATQTTEPAQGTAEAVSETVVAPTPAEIPPAPQDGASDSLVEQVAADKKKRRKRAASSVVSSVAPSDVSTTSKRQKQTKSNARTPSSYVLFSMEERKKIVALNNKYSLGEISKLCGAAWKALSQEEKTPWQTQADSLKQKRLDELAEEEKINPKKPKRPPSSYLLFAMEERKKVLQNNPKLGIADVSKMCGAAWKTLTEEERQVWKDRSASLKAA